MKKPNDTKWFRQGVGISVTIVFTIIFFTILAGFYSQKLHFLGINPRTVEGLLGIFTAPLLHGDFNHLYSNAIPLLLTIPALFYFHKQDAFPVLLVVYLLSGFWVWLCGRSAIHLGASGVVYGLISFLFFAGLFRGTRQGFAVAAAVLFFYGAPVLLGFFPSPGISFEAHISGATAGLFMAGYIWFDRRKKIVKTLSITDFVNTSADKEINFIYEYKPKDETENNIS